MYHQQLCFIAAIFISNLEAVRVHFVHWNTSNSLFFNNNVIDITHNSQSAWDYQQANIICPLYDQQVPRTLTEQYVIYNVTKEEYDECTVRSVEAAKIVALCNTPYKPKFYTLTFRSFSPTPGAFEFHPGNLYFFIGTNYLETSSGAASGHQQRRRSRPKCSHPPMRLVFRIHENSDVKKEQSMNQPREMPIIDSIIDDSSSSSISLTSTLMLIYILLLVILN